MPRVFAGVLLFLLAASCATTRSGQLIYANAAEFSPCQRECMGQRTICESSVRYVSFGGPPVAVKNKDCEPQYFECLETCPGACWADNGNSCVARDGRRVNLKR